MGGDVLDLFPREGKPAVRPVSLLGILRLSEFPLGTPYQIINFSNKPEFH